MPLRRIRRAHAFSLLVLITACESDPTGTRHTRALEISTPGEYLDVGQTLQVTAAAKDASGATLERARISWSSSNPAVLAVADGVITGRAPGTAYLKASAGPAADSVQLTVEEPIGELLVWPADTLHLMRGRTAKLLIHMKDAAGGSASHSFSVSSSEPQTVSVRGTELRGASLGQSTVTIRAGLKAVKLPVRVVTGERFSITDLGTLGGFRGGASALNNAGWAVGYAEESTPYRYRPVLWRGAGPEPLRGPGDFWTAAYAVNDSGIVAGSTGGKAWIWRDGAEVSIDPAPVPLPPPSDPQLTVSDMNDRGQVVGSAHVGGQRTGARYAAWLWENGQFAWLSEPLLGKREIPAINHEGTIVLEGRLIVNGVSQQIPQPGSTVTSWSAVDINDRGHVLGSCTTSQGAYAGPCVWDGAQVKTWPSLSGPGALARPIAINNHGEVVGSVLYGPNYALSYSFVIRDGTVNRLNEMTVNSKWDLDGFVPSDINDLGQIVGKAPRREGGFPNVVLLTPIS